MLFLERTDELKYVHLPLVTNSNCVNGTGSENSYPIEEITKNMVCAGFTEGEKGACHGDSGGPLVALNGNRYEIYGVVSWGTGCADARYPGIYGNVYGVKSWIVETMGRGECS